MRNPEYNANWAAMHRHFSDDAALLRERAAEIAAAEGFGSARHLSLLGAYELARKRAAMALRGQHRSIAEYAQWRFDQLGESGQAGIFLPDFAAFGSLDEVDESVARARARAAETLFLDEVSLPIGQPAGLAVFADAGAVLSSARRFEGAELGRYRGLRGEEVLDCIVSFQEMGEKYHFCVGHRWGELSPQSLDQFRNIATLLARQAMLFAIPDADLVFVGGKHAAPECRELIRAVNGMARKFEFYRHLLPWRDLREAFCRVEMGWEGTKFVDPEIVEIYPMLPPALRAAMERQV